MYRKRSQKLNFAAFFVHIYDFISILKVGNRKKSYICKLEKTYLIKK